MDFSLRSVRFRVILLMVSIVALAGVAVAAGPSTFTSDDFNNYNLLRPLWSFVDPIGDCTIQMNGVNTGNATFSLTVPAGVSHDLWTNGYQVPRIMQACANQDFTLEVKFNTGVSGITSQTYAAQGVLVEQDANNLVRFDLTSGNNDSTRCFSASFSGGFATPTIRIDKGVASYNVSPLWMRVQRTGNKWKMFYSFNGTTYTLADSFTYAMTATKIGVFAANAGSSPRAFTTVVDYFFNVDSPINPEDGATNVQNTIGPLIHNIHATPSSNAMVVNWNTDEPSIGSIEYGTTPSFGGSVSTSTVGTFHSIVVPGLDPSTTIYYRIVGQDEASNFDVSATKTVTTNSTPTPDVVTTSDDFNGTSIDGTIWSFTNPRGDGILTVNNGQLSIAIPGGISHDLWVDGNFAPRVMQSSSNGNFSLTAKYTSPSNSSANSTNIQGILIQADTANLIRVDLSNGPTGTQIYAIRFVNGLANWEIMLSQTIAPFGQTPVYLRVERDDARWYVKYSLDGATFTSVGDFFHVLQVTKIGMFVGNVGTAPEAYTMKVDFFQAMRPARPKSIAPANGALDIPVPTTMSWDSTTGASVFKLQLSTDTLFASIIYSDSTIAGLSKQVSGLGSLTKYFWRVAGKNAYAIGPYSSTFRFTTVAGPPAVPLLKSPADNATGVDTNATLIWTKSANASAYHLQVATDPAFASQVFSDSTLVDTSKTFAALPMNTKHYWRVRAKNAGGSSSFTASRSFTTMTGVPGISTLLAPANGTTGVIGSTTLRWTRPVPSAIYFRVQVATDSTFASNFVVNDSSIVDTTLQVTNLAYGKKFFWRVYGRGAGGYGSPSAVWNFRTLISDPSVPRILNPADGATGLPTTVTLRWTRPAGATSFHLQFGVDSTFSGGLLIDDPAVTDTSKVLIGLSQLVTYFWRVNADNIGGTSAWSPTARFTIGTTVPAKVTLFKPTVNAVVGTSANFVWNKSNPFVVRYWFEIAADSLFSFRVVDTNVTDTSKLYTALLSGQRYFWKVRAWNPAGWGPYSDVWTLNSSSSVGVPRERPVPTEFALNQNYPNPFNPSTQIEFALPHESHVTLEVYSMIGEKVATLVDESMGVGYHTVRFDAARLASGLYIYRLNAGTFTMTRKMMLVR